MKNIFFSLATFLCLKITIYAQNDNMNNNEGIQTINQPNFTANSFRANITFPVEGSVFQKVNGFVNFDLSGWNNYPSS
jgi:hypothetical protein